MPVNWPATLPDRVQSDSYNYQIGETRIRSDVDTGPAKYRRRFTKSMDSLTVSMIIVGTTQYNELLNFYDVTVNGGVTTFYFNDPVTQAQKTYRFIEPPSIKSLGGDVYVVSMLWEVMP